jgi:hypothetical protein
MEPVKPCNPYHGRASGTKMLKMPDGKSVFKVYFIDIVGRKQPERFEWKLCGRRQENFLTALTGAGIEGVGFVISFPHITKVFRYGPSGEIVLNVRAFKTDGVQPLSLDRGEGYMEFACLAEAVIAADEYVFWAKARSVDEYLQQWSTSADFPIVDHGKLGRHWA